MNLSVIAVELKVGTPIGDSIDYLRSNGGAEPQKSGGIARASFRRSEDIPWYTNAPMTVFVPKGTVVAVKLFYLFFVDSTLLADQLESSGMAALFSKLSTQKTS